MELYIEKSFVDDFYVELDFNNISAIEEIILSIFKEYGDVNKFMDITIESREDLDNLKKDNVIISNLCSYNVPIPINNIKEHFFKYSDCSQTLIFCQNKQDWFKDAEGKGALCFSIENYKQKIKDITTQLHFKIDLSEKFRGWSFLRKFKILHFNHLTITDGYILSDKKNQLLKNNLVPILKSLLNETSCIKIDIFTKELNPISNLAKHKEEKARKRHKLITQEIPNAKNNISIIMSDFAINYFDFHDRIIQTNFSLIDCGKGFNLWDSKESNSQIISETIFSKYTYDRLKRHTIMQVKSIEKFSDPDFKSIDFYMFPNNKQF